jgi:hypothetical protein
MKKFALLLICAASLCSLASCRHDSKDDSSSQAPTGKKSTFIIEEVTDGADTSAASN